MAIYTSTHTGLEIDTAIDTVDDLVGQVQIVIASAGYQIVGDFADVTKVEIAIENQVYSSKSILGYESALWRPIVALPYTPTGTDPTPGGDEAGNWVAVSVGELETIARSLNTNNNNVIYDTDEVTPIVQYIYSKSQQVVYSVPALAIGKIISSVVGGTLNTTEPASYPLTAVDLTFNSESAGISSGLYFSNITKMAAGELESGRLIINYIVDQLIKTPTTEWRVKTSGDGVTLPDGKVAVPLNYISIESFGGGEDVADNSQALLDANAFLSAFPSHKQIVRIENDITVDTDPLILSDIALHISDLVAITKSAGGVPNIFAAGTSIGGPLAEVQKKVSKIGNNYIITDSDPVPQIGDTSSSPFKIERNTSQTSTNQYLLSGAALETVTRVGFGATCTATSPTQIIGMQVKNVGDETKSGRVELNAISSYMNCIPNYTQKTLNLYNDWVMITPKKATEAERTNFAAVHALIAKKLTPGLGTDDDHDGEYGMTIQTKCGTIGFESDPDSINAESFPMDSGILINGWSGDPATVADGYSANANPAFSNAIKIGGKGGVWTKQGSSKIQNGIVISDHAGVGLFFGARHPDNTGKAIDVSANAGVSQFQTKTTFTGSGGVFMPTIPNGIGNAGQFQLYRDGDIIKIKLTV